MQGSLIINFTFLLLASEADLCERGLSLSMTAAVIK